MTVLRNIAVLLFIALSLSGMAQSRMPEVKIRPHEAPKDSLEQAWEERPYFLLVEQSEKSLDEGDYDAAALRLVEAMGIEPDNPLNVALLTNLGIIYFYADRDTLALQALDRAIERAPGLVAAHEGRARVLMSLHRDDEAYDEYDAIVAIDSLNTNARYMRGLMALHRGDLATAEADIAVMDRVIPISSRTRLAKAILYSMTSREQEAISLFRTLLEDERAPEYYSRLTACQLAIGYLGDASDTIGLWMKDYPDDAEIYFYRAILNKRRYLYDEAQRDAKRAIELGIDPTVMAAAMMSE